MIEKYIPKFLDSLYDERIKDVIPVQELIDMFHSNQVNSTREILKAADQFHWLGLIPAKEIDNTLFIGSWMGFKTKLFSDYCKLTISELELDKRCKSVSEIWNEDNKNYKEHIQGDATKLDKEFYKNFTTIINCSCEHMSDEWYDNVADETVILLQSNDFDIPQHTNIVKNMQEMKNKYKMHDIYSSTLQCTVYQRFTLAGIKR